MPASPTDFLSPEMDSFRFAARDHRLTKPWFELADRLNGLGFDMLEGLQPALDDNPRLLIAAFFIRAQKSFQSALILAERGLTGDANTVLRSAVEGAIALHALAADPAFVQALTGAHRLNQKRLAEALLTNQGERAMLSAAQIAQMETTVKEVEALMADPLTRPKPINWADVAQKPCPHLYRLAYRLLSTSGTHTNIDAAHSQFEIDATGRIVGLKTGPDRDGIVETLKFACVVFLAAADPFARAYPSNGIVDRIRAEIAAIDQLMGQP